MRPNGASMEQMKAIFEPSSIAIIGASRDSSKLGHLIPRNIIDGGYSGRIFLVNPKVDEILGLKTFASIEDIPEPVEQAIIVVPAALVLDLVEQCIRKKVKVVVVISGGFRELGNVDLEKKLIDVVKSRMIPVGIRLVGPNTMGIDNAYIGLQLWIPLKHKGSIGIITQSGSVSGAIESWAEKDGIGISKCYDLGNRIDINELDILEYYEKDPATKVIAAYLEGVTDGRKFVEVASKVSRTKPIVVLKGGRTKAGQKAAMSHTRSMAGNDEIFDAACRQAGIIRANNLEEFYDFAKAFALLPLPKGNGVLMVTSSGGVAILAADVCEKLGLNLPLPSPEAVQELRPLLAPQAVLSNPFDLTTDSTRTEKYEMVIERNLNDENIHAFMPIFADPIVRAAEAVKNLTQKTEKPIVVCYTAGAEVEEVEKAKLHSMGIPAFPSPERAAAALSALVRRAEYLKELGAS